MYVVAGFLQAVSDVDTLPDVESRVVLKIRDPKTLRVIRNTSSCSCSFMLMLYDQAYKLDNLL